MKRVRVVGTIEVVMEVPNNISLEEIGVKFKEHGKNGNYYIKNIKIKKSEIISKDE